MAKRRMAKAKKAAARGSSARARKKASPRKRKAAPRRSARRAQPKEAPAKAAPERLSGETLAKKQREISVSEFFAKNRHLLGFDNPSKALLTTIKELVDNALDAADEARIPADVDVIVDQLDDDRFKVTCADNGPGIPPDLLEKIFEPFFSTKKQGEGTGLGLSRCREIVESYGGRLTAENRREGGACFRIHLPATGAGPKAGAGGGGG